MKTQFIEVTQGSEFNWGKFMVAQFDEAEWKRHSMLPGAEDMPLLRGRGWAPYHFLVLDIETGEAAMFNKPGSAVADLNKHQVWVCPMFEPFLEWLYQQDFTDVSELPRYVKLDTDIEAMAGYRRAGIADRYREAMEWAIERLQTPKRSDGTYNYSRAAIAQRLASTLKGRRDSEEYWPNRELGWGAKKEKKDA